MWLRVRRDHGNNRPSFSYIKHIRYVLLDDHTKIVDKISKCGNISIDALSTKKYT